MLRSLCVFNFISIFLQLKLFLIYRCRDIGDDGVNYLRADLEIECYSSTHINNALSYAVPGLIFYVIVNLSKKKKIFFLHSSFINYLYLNFFHNY